MSFFQKVAEQKIKDAMKEGQFDNLPGAGERLNLVDDSNVPEDLKMAYHILKNANCTPPELSLKKEIRQVEDLLESIEDEKEKYKQIKRLNFLIMKLNMMRQCNVNFEENQRYYDKVVDKLEKKND